jgi:hypothetical protein
MNYFDDQQPLSKVGIAAMLLGLLGTSLGAFGLLSGLFDFHTPRLLVDIVMLAAGCVLMWISTKIVCSKISYKDVSGGK